MCKSQFVGIIIIKASLHIFWCRGEYHESHLDLISLLSECVCLCASSVIFMA